MNRFKRLVTKLDGDGDNRRLLTNIVGNYLVKGGAMLLSIFMMPAYMRYFESNAILGMWFTLIQILNWIMLLDFGIGGGLRNKIVEPLQKQQNKRVIELISAAYIPVTFLVILLIAVQWPLVEYLNWHRILGISVYDISDTMLQKTIHVLVIGVCVRFFTVLIGHVLYAMQLAILPGALNVSSNALILLYLLCAKPTEMEADLVKLAYINSVANNLPALLATIWVFSTRLKGMKPRISTFSIRVAKEVMGTGGALFYLQIVLMVLFNVKELYISWFVGVEAVVEYQIYYKIIGIIGGLFSLALNPVWSAVTKAMVENRHGWICSLYQKGIRIIVIFGSAQLVLVVIFPWVVKFWLGQQAISVSRIKAIMFCIYNLVYMWLMLNYNFACGMGRVKSFAIWLTTAGVSNFLLTLWGCKIYRSWIVVMIATAIASLPCCVFVQKDIISATKEFE